MGLRPASLGYLRQAGEFLGNLPAASIRQRGEPLSRFATRFEVLPAFKALQGSDG